MSNLTTLTNGVRPLGMRASLANPRNVIAAIVDWQDVTAIGTFNIFHLPARSFVTDCWFVVITSFTSDGSATMQIDEISGAGTYIVAADAGKAVLTAGSVIKGGRGDSGSVLADVAGHNDEYDTSARTVDFVTGTAAWTVGKGVLVIEFLTFPAIVD